MPTTAELEAGTSPETPEVQEITCYKEGDHWYISLVNFVKSKSQWACTGIVLFSDELLRWLARRGSRFTMRLHTLPFEGARMLELDELCTGPEGGAYYRLASEQAAGRRRLWVCDTSLLVFGDLPPRIFFRRLSAGA